MPQPGGGSGVRSQVFHLISGALQLMYDRLQERGPPSAGAALNALDSVLVRQHLIGTFPLLPH